MFYEEAYYYFPFPIRLPSFTNPSNKTAHPHKGEGTSQKTNSCPQLPQDERLRSRDKNTHRGKTDKWSCRDCALCSKAAWNSVQSREIQHKKRSLGYSCNQRTEFQKTAAPAINFGPERQIRNTASVLLCCHESGSFLTQDVNCQNDVKIKKSTQTYK